MKDLLKENMKYPLTEEETKRMEGIPHFREGFRQGFIEGRNSVLKELSEVDKNALATNKAIVIAVKDIDNLSDEVKNALRAHVENTFKEDE